MEPIEHLKMLWEQGEKEYQGRSIYTLAREQFLEMYTRFVQGIALRKTPGQKNLRENSEELVEFEDRMLKNRLRYLIKCRSLLKQMGMKVTGRKVQ